MRSPPNCASTFPCSPHAWRPQLNGPFGSSRCAGSQSATLGRARGRLPPSPLPQKCRRLLQWFHGVAGPALSRVRAATLLIVGGNDPQVLALNQEALRELRCERELAVVPGATHLFAEAGALEQVTTLATAWFTRHARPRGAASPAVSGPE